MARYQGDSEHYQKKLKNENFKPKEFVHQLCKNLDNAQDLYSMRKVVEGIKQANSSDLQHNVYRNYGQFIETSKEITYLEAEMYKLGHLLTEQKALISALTDDHAGLQKSESRDVSSLTEDLSLSNLVELVQGAAVLQDIPDRRLIHNGVLTEIRDDEEREVRMFLLNDCIMSALPTKSAWMSENYKMSDLLELKNVTVIDSKAHSSSAATFRITQYPASTYTYRADSEQVKREWVTLIKQAQQDCKETAAEEASIDCSVAGSPNGSEQYTEGTVEENIRRKNFQLEKLMELPEHLDVCIAQRNFDDAVRRIRSAKQGMAELEQTNHPELKARIDKRVRQLTEMLVDVNMGAGMYAYGKASKKPVKHLIMLDKVIQATALFLRNKSMTLKMTLRRIKMEGTMTLYIRKLSQAFFNTVAVVGSEFQAVFSETNMSCLPAYVSWVESELGIFAEMFSRQVFPQGSVLGHGVAGECVSIAMVHAQQLSSNGLDFRFLLYRLLFSEISTTLKRNHIQIIEAVQMRAKEEKWKMVMLKKVDLTRLEELLSFYNIDISKYCVTKTINEEVCFCVLLCNSVLSFVRSFHSYLLDAKKMYNIRVKRQLIESTCSCLTSQSFALSLVMEDEGNKSIVSSSKIFFNRAFIPAVVAFLESQVFLQPVSELRSVVEEMSQF